MTEVSAARVVAVFKSRIRFGRPPSDLGGSMAVFVNGQQLVTIAYIYGVIDNASQWRLAEQIARSIGWDGDNEARELTEETLASDRETLTKWLGAREMERRWPMTM